MSAPFFLLYGYGVCRIGEDNLELQPFAPFCRFRFAQEVRQHNLLRFGTATGPVSEDVVGTRDADGVTRLKRVDTFSTIDIAV